MSVSVAIITRDEEERLPACLKSAAFADEILVVDSGSQDKTVRIAKAFGCRVLSEEWRGYARQKQFAVDNCSNDWVMVLDADERILEETAEKIREILDDPEHLFSAYSFLRKNYFHDRWIRHCGWWPDRVVRLVDRRKGQLSEQVVHERWISHGAVKELDVAIEHYSFGSYSDLIHKMETYSALAAREIQKRGTRAAWWSPITHGLWMFVRTYLFELGVLEGFDGLVISILNGGGSFLKYAKAREMMIHSQSSRQE
ncbi:MAG: glycosyltransferase family 2 protein [Desulfobacteraceae bacterium]|nr:glycosyltransferase family 2 protein [Desulfobacteraceae bacterium]